jgi:hypothetical protein
MDSAESKEKVGVNAIQELDTVRVVNLLTPHRHFDSSEGRGRPPALGDHGVVVHVHTEQGEPVGYIAECVASDGMTIWLADFHPQELEPV